MTSKIITEIVMPKTFSGDIFILEMSVSIYLINPALVARPLSSFFAIISLFKMGFIFFYFFIIFNIFLFIYIFLYVIT